MALRYIQAEWQGSNKKSIEGASIEGSGMTAGLGEPVELLEYSMNAATEGIDAIATTRVVIRGENLHTTNAITGEPLLRSFSGSGVGMDIVVSSVKAYIGALNKMLAFKQQLPTTRVSTDRTPVSA
ncbi:hypothetical protein GH714_008679 [Hevea brasiliensis]|uniref:2-isopropylmalate synthase LeuA allosteric (dimerisation) domain-containing protein n=1 Tax=Hevea brasiliensis TaxID=3981 RepID=A0A6A6N7R1_HEVBR|nr:hypothetical protein GH714_008679 [Hevea brasiliensis]